MSSRGVAEVNGTRLFYEVAGVGTAVVLIHGLTFDSRSWDEQFEVFAQHFTVIRYDLRGHGRSALPSPSESHTHAEDLKRLLEFLKISEAHVVGHSLGGAIALNFALAFPDFVISLVLADPGISGYRYTPELQGWIDAAGQAAKESGVARARSIWLSGAAFAPALQRPVIARRAKKMVSEYSGWHWLHPNPIKPAAVPAVHRLGEIRARVLLIIGELNPPDYHQVGDLLERELLNVRRVIVRNAGHLLNMEEPEQFNEAVLDFLSGRSSAEI